MERDHARWQDLVLAREELEGTELDEADAHLAACGECRALLARVRELEAAGRPRGALPPFEQADLPAHLLTEAEASLRGLRERLAAAAPRRTSRVRSGWRLALPLAAAIGLAALLLWSPGREGAVISDLRVVPYSTPRGGRDGAATARAEWRTGDAFVLRFDLAAAAHPTVFHLDPAGEVALLHPADPGAAISRLSAGREHRLPPEGEGVVWTLEGEPGPETFLVAAAGPRPDLAGALAEARALAATTPRRQELVAGLVRMLSARLGPVQTVEIDHLP